MDIDLSDGPSELASKVRTDREASRPPSPAPPAGPPRTLLARVLDTAEDGSEKAVTEEALSEGRGEVGGPGSVGKIVSESERPDYFCPLDLMQWGKKTPEDISLTQERG